MKGLCHMIATAKEKGRFIDHKMFKTAGKCRLDSFILTDANMQVLDGFILYVRPLLKAHWDLCSRQQKWKSTW